MKIGMFLAPCEQTLYTGLSIPPHTLGVMTGYLRGIGHEVDQYDLETDLLDLYESGRASKADFEFIFSKEDSLGFLRGEEKPHIKKIIEAFLEGKDLGNLDIVGMSLGGSFHWMPIHLGLMIAKYIKDRYAIPVIIGGNNIFYLTLFKDIYGELWEHILKAFRFVIVGSGLEAVDIIASNLARDPAWLPTSGELPGYAYLKDGVMQHVPKAKNLVVRPDFDGLRLGHYMNYLQDPSKAKDPAEVERQNLEQMFKWPPNLIQYANQVYRRRQQKDRVKKLTIPYVFNYHCPYQCAFCAESDKNNQVVMGEAAKVVDDLEFLSKKYDTPYFYFYNNYFNLSKTFVLAFCEEVKRRKLKIHWQDCARFNGLDDDLMLKLKEAGCTTLWFGMETGGERLMTILNKKLNLGQIHDGLNLCKKHGVWANLEMIVGFPHETREDFQKTVRFINDNIENINFFQNNRYFVVPNSTIGLHPEQFEIELVRAMNTYESLLRDNLAWFRSGKGLGSKPNNFNIHGFNEIGGRRHPEILEEGQRRLILMHKMERKEFVETRQMLVLLNSLAKKKAQQKKAEAAAEA